MKELFYELIQEASNGDVVLLNNHWPIGFNTKILKNERKKIFLKNDRNLSMLYIKEEEKFFQKLEEYLEKEKEANRRIPGGPSEEEQIKYIMAYLWVYATPEDFMNPIQYLQKRIDFLEDHTFEELKEQIVISLDDKMDVEMRQEENSMSMETPNKITIQLKDPKDDSAHFHLPSIYYAIREENGKKVCYIYSLLKPKEKNNPTDSQIKFQKKINRLLFKINDGITEREDYHSDHFMNIKDVSMPFVFCLNIFISLLQRKGIEVVKAVPYLPVCYLAREITASKSEQIEELRKRNQQIQENQTDKFIRTFKRLSAQNQALQITSYPYEVDEYLTMSLSPRTKEIENMLLEESNKAVTEKMTKLGG